MVFVNIMNEDTHLKNAKSVALILQVMKLEGTRIVVMNVIQRHKGSKQNDGEKIILSAQES